jgi:hypothetical protein
MKKLGGDFWMQNKKKNEVPSDIDFELCLMKATNIDETRRVSFKT